MTVSVALPQFQGYAVEPGDVSFGEAESLDVSVNRGGRATKAALVRRSVSVRLRGIPLSVSQAYVQQALQGPLSIIQGNRGQDIPFSGDVIRGAVLVKATAQQPITFNAAGVTYQIVPEIQLEYQSQVFV